MEEFHLARPQELGGPLSFTLRDVVAAGFRRSRLIIVSFLGIFLGGIIAAALAGTKYEAKMKVLVRHKRIDPVVSTVPESAGGTQPAVSEEEINSEVELMQSRDLLE